METRIHKNMPAVDHLDEHHFLSRLDTIVRISDCRRFIALIDIREFKHFL